MINNLTKKEFNRLVREAKADGIGTDSELDTFILQHEYSERVSGSDHTILRVKLKL